jgi:hypothetical protein
MTHPLVEQLRFTRSQFLLGLRNLSEDEATRHFGQMNCISWIVGHTAAQEHRFWFEYAQGKSGAPFPEPEQFASGAPMSTPSLKETLDLWQRTMDATDPYLATLTTATLQRVVKNRQGQDRIIGTMIRRVTYHYWYHTGEIQSVRQLLGHQDLPGFVGPIDSEAPYRPED